jgi:hypothetical protein
VGCIPFFDEKKLAVWKYQMESIFFTIGCLGIASGDAKKKLTKRKRSPNASVSTKVLLKQRILGFNLLVQSMGMNAMYQSVISAPPVSCEIGDLFGAWKAIWDKYDSKKHALCRANWQRSLQIVFKSQMNRWRHF